MLFLNGELVNSRPTTLHPTDSDLSGHMHKVVIDRESRCTSAG